MGAEGWESAKRRCEQEDRRRKVAICILYYVISRFEALRGINTYSNAGNVDLIKEENASKGIARTGTRYVWIVEYYVYLLRTVSSPSVFETGFGETCSEHRAKESLSANQWVRK